MLRNMAMRFAQAIPVLILVAVLAFALMHMLPGDPAVVIAGPDATPEAVDRLRHQLGLDLPLWEQVINWLGHLVRGDFGQSLMLNQGVLSAIVDRLPVTLSLALIAFVITVPVGVLLGITAAYWRNTWIDSLVMGVALLGVSIPSFWIAIVSVVVFSVELRWLPSSGYTPLSGGFGPWFLSLVQPAIILAMFQVGYLARMTRSSMLDVLGQDYIRTARAKGMSEWVTIGRHAFRNSLMSVVTVSGIILSLLIGGSVVIEQVFALPGIGRLVVQGIMARDYPLVQGTMLLLGLCFVVVNVAVDLVYTVVDPRVRYD